MRHDPERRSEVVVFAEPREPAPVKPPVIEPAPDPATERAPIETLPLEPPSRSASAGLDSIAPKYSAIYGEMRDGEHVVPAVKFSQISPQFLRKNVAYSTKELPGAVVVDPANHFLYFVEGIGRTTRYGVGVGREGFVWAGEASIKRPISARSPCPSDLLRKRNVAPIRLRASSTMASPRPLPNRLL